VLPPASAIASRWFTRGYGFQSDKGWLNYTNKRTNAKQANRSSPYGSHSDLKQRKRKKKKQTKQKQNKTKTKQTRRGGGAAPASGV